MGDLRQMPNIGKVAESLLTRIGIESAEDLRIIGSKEVFMRIRAIDPSACINLLYGLEGAVRGVRDTALPQEMKEELKAFFAML